ncbi:MAG: metallophosphoesterase [Nanoarchaeota archaeon]
MKIVAIGDPHGDVAKLRKIPLKNSDLILVTGDLGKADLARKRAFENIERRQKGLDEIKETPKLDKAQYMEVYKSSMDVLIYLSKFAPVYTIFGNVESTDEEVRKREKKIGLKLPYFVNRISRIKNVEIINNRLRNFKGVKIGGLEYFVDDIWVETFKPNRYEEKLKRSNKQTEKAKRILNWFGKLDVLVCHQPPYGVLDKVTNKVAPKNWQGLHAGSNVILDYIKRQQPKYVFCGHIHEGEGYRKIGKTEIYNLGVCGYKIIEL